MVKLPESDPILTYSHLMRSRYSETDQMGYVYYGRYLEYFEVARSEMIRSLNFTYDRLEKEGVMLPVIYSQIAYKSPLYYDEQFRVQVLIYEEPEVRLNTFYKVFTERLEKPHVTGQVTLCFMDSETRRPRKAPSGFLDTIRKQVGLSAT